MCCAIICIIYIIIPFTHTTILWIAYMICPHFITRLLRHRDITCPWWYSWVSNKSRICTKSVWLQFMHLPIQYNINAWRLLVLPVKTYLTCTLSCIFPFPRSIWVYTVSTHSVFQNVLKKRIFLCTRESLIHANKANIIYLSQE